MKTTVKLSGFKEMDAELARLKPATGKGAMRRALKTAAQPMADLAQSMAPVGDTHTLAPSISVSTKLSKRQAKLHRKTVKNDKASVEMFVGAGPLSSAHTQEFGTVNHPPQPFMRPAWDQDHMALLDRLKDALWAEITKAMKRAAKRGQLRG